MILNAIETKILDNLQMGENVINVKEFCKLVGCSRPTLYKYLWLLDCNKYIHKYVKRNCTTNPRSKLQTIVFKRDVKKIFEIRYNIFIKAHNTLTDTLSLKFLGEYNEYHEKEESLCRRYWDEGTKTVYYLTLEDESWGGIVLNKDNPIAYSYFLNMHEGTTVEKEVSAYIRRHRKEN